MAIAQNRVIHRFIRSIADYEEGGIYYSQVIPVDTQAYAYYSEEAGRDTELWYVFGDGIHTYVEIRDGKGATESAKEFPVFTQDFIKVITDTYSKEEVNELISHIHSFKVEIVNELPETGENNILYLVPKDPDDKNLDKPEGHNNYDEYVWIDTYFEYIGNTGTAGDFVTREELNTILQTELSAEHIKYFNENYDYTNVKEALDFLLYRAPEVTLHGGGVYEKGMVINTVDLTWELNKLVTSQTLYPNIGRIDNNLRAYTIENANVSEDTIYSILVSDGRNAATAETEIVFKQYVYWGSSSSTNLDNQDIIMFSKEFENTNENKVVFDCSGGKYFYIITPSKYADDITFKINGFVFSDMVESEIVLTNASGYASNYTIFRSNNIQTGSSIEVEYFI